MDSQNQFDQMIKQLNSKQGNYYYAVKENENDINQLNMNDDVEIEQEQQTGTIFNFLIDSSDFKKQVKFPEPFLDKQDLSTQLIQTNKLYQSQEDLNNNPTQQNKNSQNSKNVKTCLKNFLILFSGWIRNYFISLYKCQSISFDTFDKFQRIALKPNQRSYTCKKTIRSSFGLKYQKVYVNLKKLSQLFNEQQLKSHFENFLDNYFLRYLIQSKTKNKSCILDFLPVLKKGLFQGRISHLR